MREKWVFGGESDRIANHLLKYFIMLFLLTKTISS